MNIWVKYPCSIDAECFLCELQLTKSCANYCFNNISQSIQVISHTQNILLVSVNKSRTQHQKQCSGLLLSQLKHDWPV